jgi:hypothetical protein
MAAAPLNFYPSAVVNHPDIGDHRLGCRGRELVYYPSLDGGAGFGYSRSDAFEHTISLIFYLIQAGHIDAGDSGCLAK